MTLNITKKSVATSDIRLCSMSVTLMYSVIMLSVIMLSVVMLNVVRLSVVMINVVRLSVIKLNVVAPRLATHFSNVLFGV